VLAKPLTDLNGGTIQGDLSRSVLIFAVLLIVLCGTGLPWANEDMGQDVRGASLAEGIRGSKVFWRTWRPTDPGAIPHIPLVGGSYRYQL